MHEIFELQNTNGDTGYRDYYVHGMNFRKSANYLKQEIYIRRDGDELEDINSFIPWIVLEAFSCEIFLKSILSYPNGSLVTGHKIYDLYYDIKEEIRIRIKAETERIYKHHVNPLPCDYDFDEYLKRTSNAFTEWRYCFETENCTRRNDMTFLSAICDGARKIASMNCK